MKTPCDPRVGVVVARFQVPELHEGHMALLNHVAQNHSRMVVVLGTAPIPGTTLDPLDYQSRARMVAEKFPEAIVVPLRNFERNDDWSRALDALLESMYPTADCALYSGRKGFADAYSGKFTVIEFPEVVRITGTDERGVAATRPLLTAEERRGAIHAISNRYGSMHAAVDVAVTCIDENGEIVVLVGRKPGEKGHWRFPGGHVDPGETGEMAAARELREETGVSVNENSFKYVGSFSVNDWRYFGTNEGIFSLFFVTSLSEPACVRASDDLAEVKWVRLRDLVVFNVHVPLLTALKNFLSTAGQKAPEAA